MSASSANDVRRYLVGGAVRDRLLGRAVKDCDWVVVGTTPEAMLAAGYQPVGRDFPVFLHPQTKEEHALARTERKSGRGYHGFVFDTSPEVTLEEDLQRRDLTINAIAQDQDGTLIDPWGGQRDLQARVLRHVSEAFAEDPLRVLRVARFAARYAPLGFSVAEETLELMRQLAESGELGALTPERSWKEISRALMETRPDVFIAVLAACGALDELMPELATAFATDEEGLRRRLRDAAQQQQPLAIRWAALLGVLIDDDQQRPWLGAIQTLGERFKVPRECQELAVLMGEYLPAARQATQLDAAALAALLQRFDVQRRPQRLQQFLTACRLQPGFAEANAVRLACAAEAVRGVQAGALVQQGFKGAELGKALEAARLEALKACLEQAAD